MARQACMTRGDHTAASGSWLPHGGAMSRPCPFCATLIFCIKTSDNGSAGSPLKAGFVH